MENCPISCEIVSVCRVMSVCESMRRMCVGVHMYVYDAVCVWICLCMSVYLYVSIEWRVCLSCVCVCVRVCVLHTAFRWQNNLKLSPWEGAKHVIMGCQTRFARIIHTEWTVSLFERDGESNTISHQMIPDRMASFLTRAPIRDKRTWRF
jgi:hypothetical protein